MLSAKYRSLDSKLNSSPIVQEMHAYFLVGTIVPRPNACQFKIRVVECELYRRALEH